MLLYFDFLREHFSKHINNMDSNLIKAAIILHGDTRHSLYKLNCKGTVTLEEAEHLNANFNSQNLRSMRIIVVKLGLPFCAMTVTAAWWQDSLIVQCIKCSNWWLATRNYSCHFNSTPLPRCWEADTSTANDDKQNNKPILVKDALRQLQGQLVTLTQSI